MRSLLWIAIIALACALAVIPLVAGRLRRWGLTRRNWRGERVLTGMGVALVLSLGATVLLCDLFDISGFDAPVAWRHFWVVLLFCAIGLVDDILGDRSVVGVAAHFRKLVQERRITGGVFQVVAGAALCVVVGLHLSEGEVWPGLVNAALLGLCANLVNMFDIRPGRALKVFWAMMLAGLLVASTPLRLAVVPLILASAAFFQADARGRAMLGDAGALALGASGGLLLIDGIESASLKFLLVLVLAGFSVLAEYRSVSGIIETNPFLAYLDKLGLPSEEGEEGTTGAPAG